MGVDKVLEIDLNNLTPQSLKAIDKQVDNIINELVNTDRRKIGEKFKDPLLTSTIDKKSTLQKIFGRSTFKNILNIGSNPTGFLTSGITKLIPVIGTALAATGIILAIITKIDNFEKKFIDRVDGRIDLNRSKEQQARVQAGLQQIIITDAAGGTEPRDAYNTFNEFNNNQVRIENDFQLRDTSGVV
jgi:hypothetical protein